MLSRRSILKRSAAIGTVGLFGAAATGSASGSTETCAPADAFVETDGTEFVVDGDPIYFNGTNNFWLTDDNPEEATRERVDELFALFDDLGINLVRMWAHGEAKEGALTLQPEPGEHDEEALKHHDYVIHRAREHGIRLIVTLVDNWEHEGGMLQYAEWTGGDTRHHFYTDEDARDLYRNHVETILTRENHITGVEYRDDPTIAMWELANEPRLERDDTSGNNFEGEEHVEILGDWFADMSAYVKDLDDNHLVSTGMEGHYHGHWDNDYPNGDWGGQDYVRHHRIDTIDACSFHLYPDHWNMTLDEGTAYLRNRLVDAAEEIGKPAYMGEFNVNIEHGLETRNEYLAEWYEVADEYDASAVSIWQVVLDETEDHDGFQVYRDESGHLLEDYAETVAEKSGLWMPGKRTGWTKHDRRGHPGKADCHPGTGRRKGRGRGHE